MKPSDYGVPALVDQLHLDNVFAPCIDALKHIDSAFSPFDKLTCAQEAFEQFHEGLPKGTEVYVATHEMS